jgi:hypothetical protein
MRTKDKLAQALTEAGTRRRSWENLRRFDHEGH